MNLFPGNFLSAIDAWRLQSLPQSSNGVHKTHSVGVLIRSKFIKKSSSPTPSFRPRVHDRAAYLVGVLPEYTTYTQCTKTAHNIVHAPRPGMGSYAMHYYAQCTAERHTHYYYQNSTGVIYNIYYTYLIYYLIYDRNNNIILYKRCAYFII